MMSARAGSGFVPFESARILAPRSYFPVPWCLSSIYRRGEAGQGETEEEQELEGGGRGGDVGGAQAGQART